MKVFVKKLRVNIENETRVFLESLDFEIEMRVSQKSERLCWAYSFWFVPFIDLEGWL